MTNVMTISDARANLKDLVGKVNKGFERILITVNGRPKVAVLSLEELESLEETAEIMAIRGAKASIIRGMKQVDKKQGVALSTIK